MTQHGFDCPYCGHGRTMNKDMSFVDGEFDWEFHNELWECEGCGKKFRVDTDWVLVSYLIRDTDGNRLGEQKEFSTDKGVQRMREVYYFLDNLFRVEVGDNVGEDELNNIIRDHFLKEIAEMGFGGLDLVVDEDIPMDGDGDGRDERWGPEGPSASTWTAS